MKYPNFIASILVIAVAFVWCGCPASTIPPSPSAQLTAPASIDFGRVFVGSFKDTSVRYTNTGNDTLRITSENFSSTVFKLADTSQSMIKIAPDTFVDIKLRFVPIDSSSITGYDTIKSNVPSGVIMLHGGGIALTRVPVIAPSVDFGNTRIGVCANALLGTPRDTNVTIQNSGNDTLRIFSVVPQSSVFSVNWFDTVIAPGGSGAIQLQFCPTQTGAASATLIITSNATQNPSLTITLTGNGVPYSPGVGSSFVYNAVKIDTTGNTIGNPYIVTQSIVATGLSYQGKTNVSQTSDTTYFEIESNGDVSIYSPGFPTYPATTLVGNGWMTLPFGTQAQSVLLLTNSQTFIDSAGESVQMTVRDSANYIGTTMVTIGGVQYHAEHVHLIEEAFYTSAQGVLILAIGAELYFSPEIGFIVSKSGIQEKITYVASTKKTVTVGGGEDRNLKSFQAQ